MFKRIALSLAIIAAMLLTSTAFAASPASPALAAATPIFFVPGTSTYTLTTTLQSGVDQAYTLGVASGQTIYVTKTGNAGVSVLDPDGNMLIGPLSQPGPWPVSVDQTGNYTFVLDGAGTVTVSFYIPPFGLGRPFPVPTPRFPQTIRFAPGSSSASFTTYLYQGIPAGFVLGVSGGQQINVQTQGSATVALLDPYGNQVPAASPQLGSWQFSARWTGNYTLVLLGAGRVLVTVSIPPLGVNPQPSVQRVRFPLGADSITLNPTLTTGVPQSYVLGAAAGQTMYIATNASNIQVFGPNGDLYTGVVTYYGTLAYFLDLTGDYTVKVMGAGPTSITFTIPPLFDW